DPLLPPGETVTVLAGPAARVVVRLQLVRRCPGLGLHGHALRLAAHPHLVDAVVLVLGLQMFDLLVLARVERVAFDGRLRERGRSEEGDQEQALAHAPIVGWGERRSPNPTAPRKAQSHGYERDGHDPPPRTQGAAAGGWFQLPVPRLPRDAGPAGGPRGPGQP